jgi:hypothetical protein
MGISPLYFASRSRSLFHFYFFSTLLLLPPPLPLLNFFQCKKLVAFFVALKKRKILQRSSQKERASDRESKPESEREGEKMCCEKLERSPLRSFFSQLPFRPCLREY